MPTTTEAPPATETTAAPPAPAAETTTQETIVAPPEAKQDGADQVRTAFMGDKDFWAGIMTGKKTEEPPAESDAAPDAEAPPEKPDKAEKPKSEKAEKPSKPEAPAKKIIKKRDESLDQRTIEVAASAAAKAAVASMPKAEAPPPATTTEDSASLMGRLDDEARDDAMVLVEIERLNPKRAGLLKEFVDFKSKSEPEYIRKWKRENPGQEFNRDNEAHDAFYDEHEPIVSDSEKRKAEREIIKREAREEAQREIAPIRERAESEERTRAIAPAIQNVEANALGYMIETMKPEVGETLRAADGFTKLQESDPELIEAAVAEFSAVRPLLAETVKIFSGATKPSPATNPIHKQFIDALVDLESSLSAQPIREQINERGQAFSPLHAFVQMSPAEQAQHWTVQQGDVLVAIAKTAAEKATKSYTKDQERYEAWAKRKGVAPKSASETTPKNEPAKPVATPAKPSNGVSPTPSPSGSGRVQVDTNQTKRDEPMDTFMKGFGHGIR